MQKTIKILFSLWVIFVCAGCSKEGCTDPTAINYNSEATKNDGSCRFPVLCNATNYTGSGSCGSGKVAISPTSCCPTDYPYACSNTTKCYKTCEDAQAVCNYPTKGTSQTGGGGSAGYNCNGSSCSYVSSGASYSTLSACQSSCGSSGTCSSTNYTGTANCGSGYVGVGGYCCPNSSPYYCSATNLCYTTCQNAKSAGCATPIKGIYQTNGGGSAGYNCNSGTCSYVSSGASYSTLSACQSSCATAPIELIFWSQVDLQEDVAIYVDNNYFGTISGYYSSGIGSSCALSGCAFGTISGSTHTCYGTGTSGTSYSLQSTVTLSPGCNQIKVTP